MTTMLRVATVAVSLFVLTSCTGDDAPPASGAPASPRADGQAPPAASAAPNSAAPAAVEQVVPVPGPVATPSATAAAASGAAATEPAAASTAPTYEVSCPADAETAEQCQVDKETYIGWRTFAGQCQVCHGGSALGSTFAPNLLDRFHQRVDYPRFVEVVRNGYTGQVGAMPAWKSNPNVEPHIDRLYRYLKARADGALPPGRPARKP